MVAFRVIFKLTEEIFAVVDTEVVDESIGYDGS